MTEAKSLTSDIGPNLNEVKSLTETELPDLKLQQPAVDFLNFPHKEKFMTEFVIGSNKLKFYGLVPIMTQFSELIKTNVEIFASSPQPHVLASFGSVLKRPMTLLWLEMNNLHELSQDHDLPLNEYLHMYRLMGYFGMDMMTFPVRKLSYSLWSSSQEEVKQALKSEKNEGTLIKIINSGFKTGILGNPSDPLLEDLVTDYPELAKKIDYIPVFLNDKYATYADRKFLTSPDIFFKSNPGWTSGSNGLTKTVAAGDYLLIITPVEPQLIDRISWKYTKQQLMRVYGFGAITHIPEETELLQPILVK